MIASYTRKITHVASLWFVHVSLNSAFTNQEDMTLIWSTSPFWIHCYILFKYLYKARLLRIDVLPTIQYPNQIFKFKYPVTSLGVEMRGLSHDEMTALCVCVWDYEGFILYSKLWWLHCLFAEAFYITILFIIAMNLQWNYVYPPNQFDHTIPHKKTLEEKF